MFSTKIYVVRASVNQSCIQNYKQKQRSTLVCPVQQNIIPFGFLVVSCAVLLHREKKKETHTHTHIYIYIYILADGSLIQIKW
jgi:hypothetical protein